MVISYNGIYTFCTEDGLLDGIEPSPMDSQPIMLTITLQKPLSPYFTLLI